MSRVYASVENLGESQRRRQAEKYNTNLEKDIRQWIARVLPEQANAFQPDDVGPKSFQKLLKSGVVLCELVNVIKPGSVTKISHSALAFKEMENITKYLDVCKSFGMPKAILFTTLDLYEAKDMVVVLSNLHHLSTLQLDENVSEISDCGLTIETNSDRCPSPTDSLKSPSFRSKMTVVDLDVKHRLSAEEDARRKRSTLTEAEMVVKLGCTMANVDGRYADVSSLTDDLATKNDFMYSIELEEIVVEWLQKLLGEEQLVPNGSSFIEVIKSGELLCRMVNLIKPGTITNVHKSSKIAYKHMENIDHYLNGCRALGMPNSQLFNTIDLFEEKNLHLVITNIYTFAQHVIRSDKYSGPNIRDSKQARSLFMNSVVESSDFLDSIVGDAYESLSDEHRELVDWVNYQLSLASSYSVSNVASASDNEFSIDSTIYSTRIENLNKDLRSGVQLLRLLEVVTKVQSAGPYVTHPSTLWQCMQNASLVMRFLEAQTFSRFAGCSAQHIVSGNVQKVASLLVYIRNKFDLETMFLQLLEAENDDEFEAVEAACDVKPVGLTEEEKRAESVRRELEEREEAASRKLEDAHRVEEEERLEREIEVRHAEEEAERKREVAKRLEEEEASAKATAAAQEAEDRRIREVAEKAREEEAKRIADKACQLAKEEARQDAELKEAAKKSATAKKEAEKRKKKMEEARAKAAAARRVEDEKRKKEREAQRAQDVANEERRRKQAVENARIAEARRAEAQKEAERASIEAEKLRLAREEAEIKAIVQREKEAAEHAKAAEELKRKEEEQEAINEAAVQETPSVLDRRVSKPNLMRQMPREERHLDAINRAEASRVTKAQTAMRRRIAGEFLSTEKSYVQSLRNLITDFVVPLRDTGLLSKEEMYSCVVNLEELTGAHEKLLDVFESRIAKWTDDSVLSDVFLGSSTDFFRATYEPYMTMYARSMVQLAYYLRRYPELDVIRNTFNRKQQATTMLWLESFFVMPIQRLPRYALLLKDMAKYTADTSRDKADILKANESVQSALDQINALIPKADTELDRQMHMIIETLKGDITDAVSPGSKFVKSGLLNFRRISGPTKDVVTAGAKYLTTIKKNTVIMGYLLHDVLLLAEPVAAAGKGRDAYKLIYAVKTADIQTVTPAKEAKAAAPSAFILTLKPETVNFKLRVNTAESCKAWVMDIQLNTLS